MATQTAIVHTGAASIEEIALPEELSSSARLGAEYPDASPGRVDTIVRMAIHGAALGTIGVFLFYCCGLS